MIRGYRVELDLNNEQQTLCRKHAGASRWAYNYGLRRKREAYKAGEKTPTAIDLHREINALKASMPWMYEISKCAFQEGLRDLDNAFKHFFRKCRLKKEGKWKGKCGYPRFKSRKKAIGSARFTGFIHVYPDTIQLPRLGLLRLKEHNYVPMNVKISSATLSEHGGRWYVSMCVHEEQAEPTPATGEVIGVDLGIKTLAVVSDGRTFDNPKALRKKITKLKRVCRRHSRKKKGSNNRKKAQRRLARMHARIAHVRQDTLHKATSALVARTKPNHERPAALVLEDLNISGMLKNRKLSRAIADVGMYEFRRQIEYKAASAGVRVVIVSRWEPSSKTCSCCGTVREKLGLNERVFVCEDCGYVTDRDYNAAKNLARLAEHENYRELHGK
ncbi:transposase [Ktedonobacter sp. SOSP1-85]|uniref:RNA-guided endonuclease InsQ/TnpB family protein n=1 Tax=Ktedonobacter sp. SOSP1-85 TaxID=2778367 RepID=UPI0019157ABD|nr:RNA-guided endonuclease TnpB family protein [Ktedonobacter sp. SOSP1-85]GHO78545.1 transposase [Ktedonobacter sp. SOSP1-85]